VIQRGVGRGGDHGRAEDDVWVEVVRELSEAGEAVTKGSAKASYSQSCLLHSIQGFAQGHTFRLRAAV
jgi:hypothetical protein